MLDDYRHALMRGSEAETPDVSIAREQLRKLIEQAVEALPINFERSLSCAMSRASAAMKWPRFLGIPTATVKTDLLP